MRDKVRAFATEHFEEYCSLVLSRMRADPPDDKALASFQWMLEWGWGRAPQALDVRMGNLDGEQLEFRCAFDDGTPLADIGAAASAAVPKDPSE